MKTCEAGHDYFKFDDATIVCRKCGDQKVVELAALIAKLPQPIYLPCPGPHYSPWVWPNTSPYPTIIYGTGTGDPFPITTVITS
jgi:hypothetical protein